MAHPQSPAIIWYAKAAAQGDVKAQQALDGLSK